MLRALFSRMRLQSGSYAPTIGAFATAAVYASIPATLDYVSPSFNPAIEYYQGQWAEQPRVLADEYEGTATIYIKPTSVENGSGHISLSLTNKEGEFEHLSFCPGWGGLGTFIAGVGVGIIPIPGINHDDPTEDRSDAEITLSKKLNTTEFRTTLYRMKEIKELTAEGGVSYSVTHSMGNPLPEQINSAIGAFTAALQMATNKSIYGHEMAAVIDESSDEWKKLMTFNCLTSVCNVLQLKQTGIIPHGALPYLEGAGFVVETQNSGLSNEEDISSKFSTAK